MAKKRLKRLRDPVELAKLVGDTATGQVVDEVEEEKDEVAVEFERRRGQKSGKARANNLTPERPREIAPQANNIR